MGPEEGSGGSSPGSACGKLARCGGVRCGQRELLYTEALGETGLLQEGIEHEMLGAFNRLGIVYLKQ